jgi:hypothetical protein
MSKQIINIGQSANDRAGDPLRTAFKKVNDNFTELYANLTSYLPNPAGYAGKFLTTDGTNLIWQSTVKLVQQDTPPTGNEATLWYDGVSGRVYTWYDDRWVDASPPLVDFRQDPPTSPQGAIGDTEGQWSGDFDYYYYCSGNYIGNNAPIWRRIAFDSSNNWDIYAGGGVGGLPADSIGYLYNNGSGTINWIPNTDGYVLPEATTSSLGGVIPDGTSIIVNSGVISATPQINSDWNASTGRGAILNKPTIPAAQIQSDWSITDNTLKSFIKNKPSIPSIGRFVFTNDQIAVSDNGNISIHTNTHNWSFNSNGSLTFPDTSIQYTAYTGTAFPSQTGNSGKFLTTNGTGTLSWATVSGGTGGGLSISDFGRGFTNTLDAGKITTSKLYNRPANLALNNHFVLEVTNGGVVILPDQSSINGATLKTVPGNYAGITAGPVGKDEDSWVYVDNDGAWIATKYSTDAFTWKFDNNGNTTFPNGIKFDNSEGNTFALDSTTISSINLRDDQGRGFYTDNGGFIVRGNGTYGWTFGTDGTTTFPGSLTVEPNNNSPIFRTNNDFNIITDGTGNTWTFDSSGNLTLPDGGIIKNYDGSQYGGGASVTESDTAPTSPNAGDLWYDTAGGRMYVYYDNNWVDTNPIPDSTPSNLLVNGDYNFTLGIDGTVNFDPSSNGKGVLQTTADLQFIAVDKIWTFGTDGLITFPGAEGFQATFGDVFPVGNVLQTVNNLVLSSESEVCIRTDSADTALQWTFGTDGDLTVPGDIKSAAGVGPVVIEANDGTARTWTFGGNGVLTLPSGGSINNSDGTPYGTAVMITAVATGTQTISNASSAQLLAWTTDSSSPANSFVSNMFTAPYSGFYQINLSLYWGAGVTQTAGFVSAVINPSTTFTSIALLGGPTGAGAIQNVSRIIQLAESDQLAFFCAQTSGSDQTPSEVGTTLSIYRVG